MFRPSSATGSIDEAAGPRLTAAKRPERSGAGSRRSTARAGASLLILLFLFSGSLEAQRPRIRGTIVDAATDDPILGASVLLLDASGKTLRQTLTGDDGEFVLEAPRAGSYAIRVERMGYRARTSPAIELGAGEERVVRFAIPIEPIPLEGLEALGASECPADPAERAQGYALYEEARDGLRAVVEGETQHGYLFVMRLIKELVDTTEMWRMKSTTMRVDTLTVVTQRPIASPTPEELARDGYVQGESGSVIRHYAPIPDVLLSDEFLSTHCFGVAARDEPPWAGFTFTPMPGREVPDVAGVLWLDRVSMEPRGLEFQYTGMRQFLTRHTLPLLRYQFLERARPGESVGISPVQMREEDFGGALDFERLQGGSWLTRRWEIRTAYLTHAAWFEGGRMDVMPYTFPFAHSGTVLAVVTQSADSSTAKH
jgi:hypothetical protein